ncbi:hypothetical protein GCM10010174_28620 [Kutzneria viridogrisea]|uniref:Transcriptional regulator with XRE-family HTH domain n=1 Tax=Kutzneria viridogrisea TaxID=47990 RepID=A0ABR6BJF5_9PSEU|nr:transcriptional regulator with XRE-family HTH domain [Kutzneria viridogrisea]
MEVRPFADLLNEACARGPRRFTNVELAGAVRSLGGEITHTYISQLRKGDRDNPTSRTVEDLAHALGVHPAYFVGGRHELAAGEHPRWSPQRLRDLFELVHPPGRGPYSPEEVASSVGAVSAYGKISPTYIRELISGTSDNPRLKHILGLAHHFGAEPSYFFDDQLAGRVNEQLQTRHVMERLGVNALILRAHEESLEPAIGRKIVDALAKALKVDKPGKGTTDTVS